MCGTRGTESEGTGHTFNGPPTVFSASTSGAAAEGDTSHPSPTTPAMPQANSGLKPSQRDTPAGHYTSEPHQTDGPSPQPSINPLHPPPVTAETLRELDIPQIVINPKLRHDVGFD